MNITVETLSLSLSLSLHVYECACARVLSVVRKGYALARRTSRLRHEREAPPGFIGGAKSGRSEPLYPTRLEPELSEQ